MLLKRFINAFNNANGSDDAVSCTLLHDYLHNGTLTCDFVRQTESCTFDDGFIQYIQIIYCGFSPELRPLALVLMFLWLFFMLIGLATTADTFFGPCLIVMADTLHLSQNVAGVTLLALGNGAPDIFSAVSAATNIKDGDAGLLFGGLLGAGVFVASITTGAIAIVKPFTAMSRPLLKDIVFYMAAVFWAFIILYKAQITIYESVGFILLYIIYVLITVFSRVFYSKKKDTNDPDNQLPVRLQNIKLSELPVTENGLQVTGGKSKSNRQGNEDQDSGFTEMQLRMMEEQRLEDAAAGYDTSLDFPGGLQRLDSTPGGGESSQPKSNRFKELEYSERQSKVSQTVRLSERMLRVSRVQLHATSPVGSPKHSTSENPESGRKISTASFTGMAKRSNYLARWMMAYGNLEDLEQGRKTSRASSIGSGSDIYVEQLPPRKISTAVRKVSEARKVSVGQRKISTTAGQRKISTGGQRKVSTGTGGERKISLSKLTATQLQVPMEGKRAGFKLSGGLGLSASENPYFVRKRSQQHQKEQQAAIAAQAEAQAKSSSKKGRDNHSYDDMTAEEEEARQGSRQLYRIESVDEALDDDNLDRLNQLNERRKQEEMKAAKEKAEEEAAATDEELEAELKEEIEDELASPIMEFLYSINPIDPDFSEMTWYNKIYEIIKCPLLFLLLISTSLTDYDKPMNGWTRILNSFHCMIAPVFIFAAFRGYTVMIAASFPVIVVVLIVGAVFGLIVFFTSSHFKPPVYHNVFAFIGFATAIIWIYTFANEVVNVLETCGIVFRISSTILGLTVLAWANSIGDVISNTVLARQNFPRIAISACFGGPLFNLLLGIGIPFTIKLLGDGITQLSLKLTEVQLILLVFLVISLASSMTYLTLMGFKVHRPYGIYLTVLYVVFLTLALLSETIGFGIIPKS